MNGFLKWFLFFTLLIYTQCLAAQDELSDSLQTKRYNNIVIPIAFYLPETGFAFGGTGIFSFRLENEPLESRPSQILYSAAYTLKNQLLIYFPFEIYRNNEKDRFKGEIGYYRYFYNFYGLGAVSKLQEKENYSVNFPRVQLQYLRKIKGGHHLGVGFKYDYFDLFNVQENGILDDNQFVGIQGGQTTIFPVNYLFDNRNHVFFPSKGFYADIQLEWSSTALISDYSFNKLSVDVRSYSTLFQDFVLANQIYASTASENTPFYYLPYVSSTFLARGYADRRFIDYTLISAQTEIRYPIYKRFKGVAFASLTQVGQELKLDESLKWSVGAGIRFVLNKKELTRIRADIGFTPEGFNFYITANEAF